MASSGVKLDPKAVDVFNEMKLRHKTQFLMFKIEDGTIILDEQRPKGEGAGDSKVASNATQWEEFCKNLPPEDCRYAVFDYYMEHAQQAAGNRVIESLIFVVWIPETANIRKKMIYASSKDEIKKKLLGLQAEVQATDLDELSPETVEQKIKSSKSL
jgi:cofilin